MLNQNCLKKNIYFLLFVVIYPRQILFVPVLTHTNLKKKKKKKNAASIICNEDRLTHAKPLIEKLNILDVYQLNII